MIGSAPELIGQSQAWLESLERVSLAAPIERPLLVVGERGTGKELIAERVHFLSKRWDGPFVKVNCAALSEDLLDSELFGHEQGAFTGATKRRLGRFEQADKGTLFLDEIATASMEVQEKLLRVIEYGEFQRLGGEEVLHCDVRVVGATNVDLPSRANDGRFRADLLDRLAFDVITLAPLRARGEDIAELAEYFGNKMARELGFVFPGFSRGAIAAFKAHDWPGNVRELKNASERAVYRDLAMRAPHEIDVPVNLNMDALDPFASGFRPAVELGGEGQNKQQQIPTEEIDYLGEALEHHNSHAPIDFEKQTAAFEQRLIDDAFAACGGHQKNTAEHLGLSYNQFRGLLRKYGYQKNSTRSADKEQPSKGAKGNDRVPFESIMPKNDKPRPGM
ncbi:phage shock protein operon transcriptional activator [Hirschia baltica]|uniref:Sigma54 specific transcriptional activator, PspF, Fis family n=1 Tax=Hirschia baltica (strain ATCC 49814 / DSM 5838 / IFAM 1418) TaxID=582402 RepID=C6XR63_HIRBI|nr:phage shock protein operon transcriptional activator [Hirschia baltica]ACT60594.1 sigma54 specific transcriptional activator, PspF, Fis family [Hirschia baltica ATCC 49814]